MISTKGRYALRVMIDIAEQNTDNFIALKDIAKRQGISKKYLEAIVKKLVDAKLLTAISGKNGGYKLSKPASKYNRYEMLELTEGTLSPVACVDNKNVKCQRKNLCKTYPMWLELDNMISKYLKKRKLSEFLN